MKPLPGFDRTPFIDTLSMKRAPRLLSNKHNIPNPLIVCVVSFFDIDVYKWALHVAPEIWRH